MRRSGRCLMTGLAVALLGVAVCHGGAARAASTGTKGAHLAGNDSRTRFVAGLSKAVEIDAFTLANPYRVVVDMPNIRIRLPAKPGRKGRGLVKSFRAGHFIKGRDRIVIDVTGPVAISRAAVVATGGRVPAQLILDIVPTDPATFKRHQEARKRSRARRPVPQEAVPLPEIRDAARDGRTVIIIDPGHGGIDSGALSRTGTEEKSIVLSFGKLLRDRLKASGKYEVFMTRNTDVFVPLGKRVTIAQAKRADLFISLHADYVSRRYARRARGSTVYTLSKRASDRISRELAHHANKSDIIAGVEFPEESNPVRKILTDLLRRETDIRTRAFSAILVSELRQATKMKQEPHRSAAFRVLKAPDIPSVLIELGYLSNREDEKLLMSDTWRKKVADQIAAAVDNYLALRVAKLPF